MPNLTIIFSVAILLLSAIASVAGEAKTREISARIICIQNQQGIETVRFGPTSENVGLPQRLLIGDYSLPFLTEIADDTLSVFKDPCNASDPPITTAKVPADARHVTLLFVPDELKGYRVFVMPDDKSVFKVDSIRFLNLSPLPVRFRIEEQVVDLPVGKLATLDSIPKRDRYNMANVAMASLVGNEWKVVSQTQWHFVEGNRLLALVYVRPGTQRLVAISFRDRPGSENATVSASSP